MSDSPTPNTPPTVSRRMAGPIRIFQGDDVSQLAELNLAVELAQQEHGGGRPRLGGEHPDVTAARQAYEDFAREAIARTVLIRVGAMKPTEWFDLLAEHPPREITRDDGLVYIHPSDQQFGANMTTLRKPLLEACIVEPKLHPDHLAEFLESLAPGDYMKVVYAAIEINGAEGADPKDVLPSSVLAVSDET